jgi:hypothetical protein
MRAAGKRLAWWQHTLAVGAIALAAAIRFHAAVGSAEPLGDELAQEGAYRQQAAGQSPYRDGGYVYPPSLLRLGVALRHLPLPSPFLPLRCLTLLGLGVLLWTASAWLAHGPWPRLAFSVAYAALAPGVRQGVEFGNLSFAVGGMVVLALLIWRRQPVGSGLLLGASLLVKPLAPAALLALLFHRPPEKGQRHRLAVAIAVFAAALALVADPELASFLRHASGSWVVGRTVSLHRLLSLADLPGAASVLTSLLLAAVAWVAHRSVRDREPLLALALAGCVMTTPVVWNHTLVLTLPLQTMAIAIAVDRYRAAAAADRRWRGWEAAGIGLAVLALTFAEGATGIDDRGVALQIFATLPPALSPAILAAYVCRSRPAGASGEAPQARKSS